TIASTTSRTVPPAGGDQLCPVDVANLLDVLAMLHHCADRGVGALRVEFVDTERHQGLCPVNTFSHAWRLDEVGGAQGLRSARDVSGEPLAGERLPPTDDRHLAIEGRMLDPVIEASPLQRVVHVAASVGRDDDDGWRARADHTELGHGDGE